MIRQIKAYMGYKVDEDKGTVQVEPKMPKQMPKSRKGGKRRRSKLVICENENPNQQLTNRDLVSSVKFDCFIKKRDRKGIDFNRTFSNELNGDPTCSASTTYSMSEI
jgi:hypothetical protein